MINHHYRGVMWHKHLSKEQRAAQFMPFAALNGYGEKIQNATDEMNEKHEFEIVDESGDSALNEKLLEDESFDDTDFWEDRDSSNTIFPDVKKLDDDKPSNEQKI